MRRNLYLTQLRSFVAVAEAGGVTRAAGLLNLTQSAVSMQLKRLEETLDLRLFDRANRQLRLTAHGEQLLGYARRMLALNDEIVSRMTDPGYEGKIVLGVPHDIVYPVIPEILQKFHAQYPRMRVNLLSSNTRELKGLFAHGDAQIILTTEDASDAGAETLVELPLIWVGAPGGVAWKSRPLRLAFEHRCIFRQSVQRALDEADIPWEMAVESESTRTVEASVSADLAIHAALDMTCPPYMVPVPHDGTLPDLQSKQINMYHVTGEGGQGVLKPLQVLTDMLRSGYRTRLGRDHDFAGRTAAA
ncbi:LysR family transcriptional regulator [Ovoidimarina sediminis]|uniref:LysR family transcriptional regulator n=1 Tax=Ovoidimarina sediminis TaxID=3079856 RepID=UPI0029122939|nr:LysR family transcriptional regulator [Rhodophyticola sp. MJ-SS7]MDU8945398.1 LysR family transcriptional regulator [Rhodophyticola sp. MJ-SS7]